MKVANPTQYDRIIVTIWLKTMNDIPKVSKDGTVRIHIRIRPEVKARLEELAEDENRSFNNYVETVLLNWLKTIKA